MTVYYINGWHTSITHVNKLSTSYETRQAPRWTTEKSWFNSRAQIRFYFLAHLVQTVSAALATLDCGQSSRDVTRTDRQSVPKLGSCRSYTSKFQPFSMGSHSGTVHISTIKFRNSCCLHHSYTFHLSLNSLDKEYDYKVRYDVIWYIYLLQLNFHPVAVVGKLVQKL